MRRLDRPVWARVPSTIAAATGVAFASLLPLLSVPGLRADWPQFLGPARDGVSPGGAVEPWPETGPAVQWKAEVGSGFSGPVSAGDLVLLHHRRDGQEILEAFDRGTGVSRWKSAHPATYVDDYGSGDGPRGTPAVAGDLAFAFGADARLSAVRLRDGSPVWSRALGGELRADKGFFGFACSPLVVSNRVIVQLGGSDGAGVVALDAASGKNLWKATTDEAGYASPVLDTVGGKLRVVVFNRAGVRVLDPEDGTVTGKFDWRSRQHASVNAASPVVTPTGVLVTSSYDTGAAFLRWTGAGAVSKVWSSDDALSSHYPTPVRLDGLVFGFHGRQEQGGEIRCVDLANGDVRWASPRVGMGSVLRAGDRLVVLMESGELVLAEANASAWKPLARAQVLGNGARAVPALDADLFLARDARRLVAVRLKRL